MFKTIHAKKTASKTAVRTAINAKHRNMAQRYVPMEHVILPAMTTIQNQTTLASQPAVIVQQTMPRDVSIRELRAKCKYAQTTTGPMTIHAPAITPATVAVQNAANVQIMPSNVPAEHLRFVQKAHGRRTVRVQMHKSAKMAAARIVVQTNMSMKIHAKITQLQTVVRMETYAVHQPMEHRHAPAAYVVTIVMLDIQMTEVIACQMVTIVRQMVQPSALIMARQVI